MLGERCRGCQYICLIHLLKYEIKIVLILSSVCLINDLIPYYNNEIVHYGYDEKRRSMVIRLSIKLDIK